MADNAQALTELILAAGHLIVGTGSPRQANGVATITSDDRTRSVTALVPANWVPGPAIAAFDQSNQRWLGISGVAQGLIDERIILSERHIPQGGARDIGLVYGLDIYEFLPAGNYMLALNERGKRLVISGIDTGGRGFQIGFCDVDESGKPHAFISVIEEDTSRPSRGIVSHNGQSKVIQFPFNTLPFFYPSQCRCCNDWFWSFPVAPAGPNPFDPSSPDIAAEKGFTFSVFNMNEAADMTYFDIAIVDSGEQGSMLGGELGTLSMSGTQATYPGGPTYPFSYNYHGRAGNVLNVDYSSIPDPENIGPLDPPVPDDELAEYPITVWRFSPTIGGISTPLILIFNGISVRVDPINFVVNVVSWTDRAIWTDGTDGEPPTIRLELRGPLYGDLEITEASLTGTTSRTTFNEGECTANYTLPMLVDTQQDLMIAERFSGSTYIRIGRENEQSTSEATANEAYSTESGTHETFFRAANGDIRPVDGFWQYQFYIHASSLPKQTELQVGQVISANYESTFTDTYLNPQSEGHIRTRPAMVVGVPGSVYGVKHWSEDIFDQSDFKARITRNTPRPDHLADLQRKLSVGAKVYGILWENQTTWQLPRNGATDRYATVFKGVIKNASFSVLPVGSPAPFIFYPNPINRFQRMQSAALCAISSLDVEVTEIVSDKIRETTWDFFGDYWWGKMPYNIGKFAEWTGQLTLDGSIRNIYTTEAYSASWIAQAFLRTPRYVIGEGTFEETYAGSQVLWADPYVWRMRRYYNTNGHYEGWAQGKEGLPMQVARWKLDYSDNEVRCWFDGVSEFDLKPFDRSTYFEASDFAHISFDRKKALEQLQQGLP